MTTARIHPGCPLVVSLALAAAAACSPGELDGSAEGADGGSGGPPEESGTDAGAPCSAIEGVSYQPEVRDGPVSDRPAHEHADLNPHLRGWTEKQAALELVDVGGPTDELAPMLATLLTDDRMPTFVAAAAAHDWDWGTNERAGPVAEPEVTWLAFATEPGEVLELPQSGYDIGNGAQARVLFAADDAITAVYTRRDDVAIGYALHVVGVCPEPSLRALYEAEAQSGREAMPGLAGDQAFGRAMGDHVWVAIRDSGTFMDPRVRKDWW